jgi:natural product biosynthesis luciferase-like monooxygenase protein
MKRNYAINTEELMSPTRACVHTRVEEQTRRTPERTALIFEDTQLTYRALNERADRLAARLTRLGVGPNRLVGIDLGRSIEMVVGALAVLKAGGGYVSLDSSNGREHTDSIINNEDLTAILSQQARRSELGKTAVQVVFVDDVSVTDSPIANGNGHRSATCGDLACVVYTPGSNGQLQRVAVEHRKLADSFAVADKCIGRDQPGTWLSLASLSSELSIVELFWTLACGFTVVVQGDVDGYFVPAANLNTRSLGFSLFMWGNDDAPGRDKYRLMLEGAKYFDRNGFEAVWTPERHFHAFGGPYPNPSVTAAALAAVTERISIRAGSCVSPLHHPIRIAEDWAVVDNLSNGRVALAFASGWQLNDFVLRPENHANNKRVMLDQIDQVRRLWRGEKLGFPNPLGQQIEIQTLPRPVQPELPLWVTTAGNPESYRQAGELGANILTHLLGQSMEEVAQKIIIYRQARAAAGHDPSTGRVTLMLHTFVGDDDGEVRELVRQPMKNYLRSSLKLVLEIASSFPNFKPPTGGAQKPQDIDLRTLPENEMQAMLDFAFERYFETSGLFGSPSTCGRMVERCKQAGVDEIACLLDFGVPTDRVLASLPLLNHVRQQASLSVNGAHRGASAQRFSIGSQIERHGITHLQCTSSLARKLLSDRPTRAALSRIRHMFIGNEEVPAILARELKTVLGGELRTINGPAGTSSSSTTQAMGSGNDRVRASQPTANSPVHSFLALLRQRNIEVGADGDRLRCSAPPGALTPELRDELQQRKNDILKFLHSAASLAQQQRSIVPLQSRGNRTPIFAVAGHNGDVFCYRALSQHLGDDQPFFGLQPPGLDGQTEPLGRVEDLAAYFAGQIRAFRPDGPYVVAGFCAGGGIALELTRQLLRDGATIDVLALFGCRFPTWYRFLPQLQARLENEVHRLHRHVRAMTRLSFEESRAYITDRVRSLRAQRAAVPASDPVLAHREKVGRITVEAVRHYAPGHFAGHISLFWPTKECVGSSASLQWRSVAQSTEESFGPEGCTGDNMLREPHARVFAELFRQSGDKRTYMGDETAEESNNTRSSRVALVSA